LTFERIALAGEAKRLSLPARAPDVEASLEPAVGDDRLRPAMLIVTGSGEVETTGS
jgi:hypothetical protein